MTDPSSDAGQRTEYAEDRTMLANERTFAGWMRTGLASIGVGVGFSALFRTMEPDWVPRAVATAFLVLGALIVFTAERRACAVATKMRAHYVEVSRPLNLKLISTITIIATIALIAAVWLVRFRS